VAEAGARERTSTVLPRAAAEQQGRPAGVVSRTVTMVIDAIVVVAQGAVLYAIVAAIRLMRQPRAFTWPKVTWPEAVAVLGVLCVIYLTWGWTSTGRTIGDRLMGLRVVDRHGDRLHFVRAFLRAVVCALFPLGLYWCVVSRRSSSIQDLVFGTAALYDWKAKVSSSPKNPPRS
jgi:uncharacterized RDD family membrane protein YckC